MKETDDRTGDGKGNNHRGCRPCVACAISKDITEKVLGHWILCRQRQEAY